MQMSDKSIWVNYLDKRITEDKYTLHREKCAYQLEGLVSQMTQDLLKHNPDYTTDIARKGAINLLMEQMLTIQHEYTPQSQKAMTMALFEHLPSLSDFRKELIDTCCQINQSAHNVAIKQKEYIATEKSMTGFQKVIQFFKNNF